MDRVLTLRIASKSEDQVAEPGRLDARSLKTLVARTRRVANCWQRLFHTSFGEKILKLAERGDIAPARHDEFLNIPHRLLSLAQWAKDAHQKTARGKRPLFDDRLATLTEYVNARTGDYHDREVSALVGWAIGNDSYSATTLSVWRSDHPTIIKRARLRLQSGQQT